MTLPLLHLAILALPRVEKQTLADWLDGLTRGRVGPIVESLAELQVDILRRSLEDVTVLRDFARARLAQDQPELVGDALMRSITAIANALRTAPED